MARQLINNNSTEPLGGPNQGLGTDQGDLWNTAVSSLNAMTTELYNRTGGTGSTTNNLPSGWGNFRNMIDGGDFTINPWQRGTAFTGIAATVTYTADRFFVVGNDASVSAKAAKVAFSSIAGMSQAFRFGRANTASSLSAIVAGQILESNDSVRGQGQTAVLSFWAMKEANFSAASNNLTAALVQGTGTDQSAASAVAGSWSAQTNVFSALQALTTTMTRYSFSGTVSNNTAQLGVLLNYIPVGSAGAADSVLIEGVQLELNPTAGPSDFEHRDVEVELALCQRYAFVINEPSTSGVVVGTGGTVALNRFVAQIPLPTPMRTTPTLTVTNGSFGFQLSGAYVATTGLTAYSTHTQTMMAVAAAGAGAQNLSAMFVSGSGAGQIVASAEY